MPGLGLPHPEPIARPVEIIQFQTLDIDATQTEPRDQCNDRVVPFAAGITLVDGIQNPGDIGGIPHRWNSGVLAGLHRRDSLQYVGIDLPPGDLRI